MSSLVQHSQATGLKPSAAAAAELDLASLQAESPRPGELDLQSLQAGSQGAGELDLANLLHALSDPVRLRIVAKLADGEEHTCGSFGLPVTKSTCSHHFRVLREAGVLSTRTEGKNRLNRLERDQLEERFPGLIGAVLRAHVS